eukprot:TRINITY_DN731_c1_g2_i3.p1 TRINITY_DN731_c1_g2~~TRINITY_DN731_c1_g2_i3.p1  ORF type:complete len:815 (+),score=144.56 TRINITY_DN731_c1_g2_i3:141-2585(+)
MNLTDFSKYLTVMNLKKLDKYKLIYRIFTTSYIVIPPDHSFSFDRVVEIINEGTSHHTVMRKRRVFNSLEQLMEAVVPGDCVFLNEGTYDEPLNITVPVHISGRVQQKIEKERVANLLVTRLRKNINFDCPNGISSLICCHLPSSVKVTLTGKSRVSLQSLVFHGESYVSVGGGAVLRMWRSGLERGSKSVVLEDDFGYIDMFECYFGSNNFSKLDLVKVINKLNSVIESDEDFPDVAIGCANTFAVVCRMKSDSLKTCFFDNNAVPLLHKAMIKWKNNSKVLLSILQTMTRMLLAEEPSMMKAMDDFDIIPLLLEIMSIHENQLDLQKWIAVSLKNFLNHPKCLNRFRDEKIYNACLVNLEKYKFDAEVLFEIVSFLWHSVHFLLPIRTLVVRELPRVITVLEEHKDDPRLYKEVLGLVWNLSGTWPDGITCHLVPHLIRAFKILKFSDYATAHILLGSFLIVTRRATLEEINSLIDNSVVTSLLEVKAHVPVESEAEYRFWKAVAIIAKSTKSQKVLLDLISRDLKHPPLTELDRVKIARSLTIHKEIDNRLYVVLQKIIDTTKDSEIFFICMDAVVHLMMNVDDSEKEKIRKIGELVIERAPVFSSNRKVVDWLGWAKVYILGLPRSTKFGLDPKKSAIIHISDCGLVLRHEFWGTFGSAISTSGVTKGKWYYEAQLLTVGLFFVGWVNDRFRPEPYEGIGVGSDEHSWAVDLKKHTIRHTNSDGSVRLPYAKDITPAVGGYVQCYLDLDSLEMSFGYNGQHLGVAFEKFVVAGGMFAAVSTNLENECKLNFGSTPFRYPQTEYRPLCECE